MSDQYDKKKKINYTDRNTFLPPPHTHTPREIPNTFLLLKGEIIWVDLFENIFLNVQMEDNLSGNFYLKTLM